MCSNVLEINTKAMCLFCYTPSCPSSPSQSDSTDLRAVSGVEKLLRYLEVNNTKLYQTTRQFILNLGYLDIGVNEKEEIGVKVTLCYTCCLVMEKFDELSSQYDTSSCQLDKCVRSVYEAIKHASESPTRVDKYMDHMRSEQVTFSDLFHASFAATLRIEIFNQCSFKLMCTHRDTGVVVSASISSSTPIGTFTTDGEVPHTDNAINMNISQKIGEGTIDASNLTPGDSRSQSLPEMNSPSADSISDDVASPAASDPSALESVDCQRKVSLDADNLWTYSKLVAKSSTEPSGIGGSFGEGVCGGVQGSSTKYHSGDIHPHTDPCLQSKQTLVNDAAASAKVLRLN